MRFITNKCTEVWISGQVDNAMPSASLDWWRHKQCYVLAICSSWKISEIFYGCDIIWSNYRLQGVVHTIWYMHHSWLDIQCLDVLWCIPQCTPL